MSERTLQRRLHEARERLKARLIRRGHSREGGMLTAVLLREAQITVPAAWTESTIRAALDTVNYGINLGVISAAARELTREVLKIMLLRTLTFAVAALLAAGMIGWGVSTAFVSPRREPMRSTAASVDPPQRRAAPSTPRSESPSAEAIDKVTIRGKVLGPDGRPIASAKIYRTPATFNLMRPYPSPEHATTGPDGRFQFLADKRPKLGQGNMAHLWERTVVAATTTNYGVAWAEVAAEEAGDDLTLQLVDDEPIIGRIIDLEGRPVQGATLQVLQIRAPAKEDIGPWLESGKGKTGTRRSIGLQFFPRVTIALAPKVTTDAGGGFQLTGIGRNRLVLAQLDGPSIVSEYLNILSRPAEPIEVLRFKEPRVIARYYGATFEHVAAPDRPIVGVVRDRDTRQPLAGVTIRSYKLANNPDRDAEIVQTTTDNEGRYRLTGMPKGAGNQIMLVPRGDQPYLSSRKDLPDGPGLDPVTVDLDLKRGIWIEGKITDKVTGEPQQGRVSFFAQPNNPSLGDYVLGGIAYKESESDDDGSYRVAGMPGPGFITVAAIGYLSAPDRNDDFAIKGPFITTMLLNTYNYCAVARIEPARGIGSMKQDVTLDPGWTVKGKVLGPDGQPLAGTWGIGLDNSTGNHRKTMKTSQFTLSGYNPFARRDILFQHATKKLVGVARQPENRDDSITVKMESGAPVIGRLMDINGRPRAGVELELCFRSNFGPDVPPRIRFVSLEHIRTDQEGRFHTEALWPGYRYRLTVDKGEFLFGDGLRSGQTMDLGDVTIRARQSSRAGVNG